ncbi:MAG TPA: TetR/AcrR family transcriptional regulator [Solirubrobacteraceae bacterium]
MATSPLQRTPQERRGLLARHFVGVVEQLIDGGEPYADLSVERLITAGGISRSTFYAYFEDKGALLSAMAEDVIAELFTAGESWWSFPDDGDRAQLREALRPALETQRRHHAILGAVADTAAYDSRVREQHLRLVSEVAAKLATHVRGAQRRGTACPDLDAARVARWLIWMHERGLHQLVTPAAPAEAEKLLDALTDVVWRTLYAGYR